MKGNLVVAGLIARMKKVSGFIKKRADKSLLNEMLRKFLHIICTFFLLVLVNAFNEWYDVVIAMLVFVSALYPVLTLIEHFPQYGKFFYERRKGEVKKSVLILTVMVIVLVVVFWGLLGVNRKYIIIAAIMAWGFGDAAAALIGKAFGRHFIEHRHIEGKKTVEGTLAMYMASSLAIFATMMLQGAGPWYLCLAVALMAALVCAVVELFSLRGSDTITVPLSAAISMFILVSFFSRLGV